MSSSSFYYFALVVLATGAKSQPPNYCGDVANADTLKMTIVLFRHGDRTPLGTYPNDPYQLDYWEKWGGWSCLTQLGMEQQFHLGRWVRKCYGPVINETYIPKEIYLRSSGDIDRTILSGLSHLAGMFAPKGFQIWSNDEPLAKLWQPIPIHSVLEKDEFLLKPNVECPPFDAMVKKLLRSDATVKKIQREEQLLLDYIATNAGLRVPADLLQIQYPMPDAVYVENLMGLKLPGWINSTILHKLIEWKDIWFKTIISTEEMLRLGMGEYIRNLRQILQNKKINKVTYKHIIYSAHDATLGPLMKIYDPNWNGSGIPYAAGLFTELHFDRAANRYFVKVFYRNDTLANPYPIKLRNCGNPCWLEDFDKAMEPFSMENKKAFCFPEKKDPLTRDETIVICVLVTFGGTAGLLLLFFLVVLPAVRRKQKEGVRRQPVAQQEETIPAL